LLSSWQIYERFRSDSENSNDYGLQITNKSPAALPFRRRNEARNHRAEAGHMVNIRALPDAPKAPY
jgi:hypothetical protein